MNLIIDEKHRFTVDESKGYNQIDLSTGKTHFIINGNTYDSEEDYLKQEKREQKINEILK
jgi:hypothetical protein